eukprot:gene12119-8342_t
MFQWFLMGTTSRRADAQTYRREWKRHDKAIGTEPNGTSPGVYCAAGHFLHRCEPYTSPSSANLYIFHYQKPGVVKGGGGGEIDIQINTNNHKTTTTNNNHKYR